MITRARARKAANSSESISDHSEYDSTTNDMDDLEEQQGASGSNPVAISADQIALLVSSITSLPECVEELRRDAYRSRHGVGGSSANAVHTDNVQSPLRTPAQAQSSTLQVHTQQQAQTQQPFLSTHLPPCIVQTPTMNTAALTCMDNSAAKLFPLPNFDGNSEDWPLF
ncbi:PREDICTED: uncharacterized protein LOC108379114 [Rhagoletis zephyria]|uniref:uncharacterized protein LOC108379114 n=1 Tax=Rhagoletis zephyria TaxID=28612 RepID=UPI0008116B90|nr:PREDICTED: uncharacterized protein LOC108379114 [Rhagoletis zephyria]